MRFVLFPAKMALHKCRTAVYSVGLTMPLSRQWHTVWVIVYSPTCGQQMVIMFKGQVRNNSPLTCSVGNFTLAKMTSVSFHLSTARKCDCTKLRCYDSAFPQQKSGILCSSVCQSAREHISRTEPRVQRAKYILCTLPWPWLSPLAALRHVMLYFRFRRDDVIFAHCCLESETRKGV